MSEDSPTDSTREQAVDSEITESDTDSDDADSEVGNTPIWWGDPDPDAERRFVERHGHVNQIAVGTILEYDGWQWALVTEVASDREEPHFGVIFLDQLPDDITKRVEAAHGCRQHYAAVEHLTGGEHEYWAPVDFVLTDDVWEVLGPIHPDYREGDDDTDTDQVIRCDGGDPSEQEDTDTQTVDIVGPTRFRYELTDEELERVKESNSPISEIDREPVEWELLSGEWEVNDG